MIARKPKIAFIHRYGLEGWVCCGGHAVPLIVQTLSPDAEIHFYGPRGTDAPRQDLRRHLTLHTLPFTWDRANPRHKVSRTLHWYFWLPLVALRCRFSGVRLVWNDETVPFTASLLRAFYGRNVVLTVMDFFARIYTEQHPRMRGLCRWIEAVDLAAWRKLPMIFTKVDYTRRFLAERGVPAQRLHLYRNPVDHAVFFPFDAEARLAARQHYGFAEHDLVLSHHGILHPNKGNDWILDRLRELADLEPRLKLLLIGNGPESSALQRKARQCGLEARVLFTGWLPTEAELNRALNAADIGLVMRIGQETDHFHMTDTLAHEMACGKPLLAVRLHGIAEVLREGENGCLFSPEDPEGFRTALLRLAHDPALRTAMGAQALETSRRICSVAPCAEAVASCLRALASPNT